MSKLSDAIAELEAKVDERDAKIATLERQVERQKGAIEEGRAERGRLLKQLEEACGLNGTYRTHFHGFHGSAKHVANQEKALADASTPPAQVIDMPQRPGLMDRLAGIGRKRDEVNGATNGHAA